MDDRLTVPWKSVALGVGLAAVASTATLAIVVSVRDVEVLSTVALALAILAFGAQLVASLAQGQAAGEQRVQSERLNNETLALLAEIRTATVGLRGTVERQFGALLEHVLTTSVPAALEETTSLEPEVKQEILTNVRTELESYSSPFANPRPPEGALRRVQVGDVVDHSVWGRGTVVEDHGEEAVIDFEDSVGRKRLLLSWAPLRLASSPSDDS